MHRHIAQLQRLASAHQDERQALLRLHGICNRDRWALHLPRDPHVKYQYAAHYHSCILAGVRLGLP